MILNQKAKASIKHDAMPIKSGGVASQEVFETALMAARAAVRYA